MAHEPRLTAALRALLNQQRVAALGTLDEHGAPFVSMVPYALLPAAGELVIHVSGLAAHTRNLERSPRAALMVCQAEVAGEPVHALARVSLDVTAQPCPAGSAEHAAARTAYLARFPEAEPMTALGDFRFVRLQPAGARQVAGFGAARSVAADELRAAIGPAP
jgi:putative heme iron utilization protein